MHNEYGERIGSSLVKIAQIGSINPTQVGAHSDSPTRMEFEASLLQTRWHARRAAWMRADLVHLVSLMRLNRPQTDERPASPCASRLSRFPAPAKAGSIKCRLETAWRFTKSAWYRLLFVEGDGAGVCQTLGFLWREDGAWSGQYCFVSSHVMNCGLLFLLTTRDLYCDLN
jgi:hypothetical protein